MKNSKKILCLLLALMMVLSFAACNKNTENSKDKETALTADEAEKAVEEALDTLKELELGDVEFSDELDGYFTEDCIEKIEDTFDEMGKESGMSDSDEEEEMDVKFSEVTDLDYEIKSSDEKDGEVVVKVKMTNKDYSAIMEMTKFTTSQEVIAYLQNAVDKGLITVDEANAVLKGNVSDKELFEFYDKLTDGEECSATIEFTVVKDGDEVMIDDVSDTEDLIGVISLNILGTL